MKSCQLQKSCQLHLEHLELRLNLSCRKTFISLASMASFRTSLEFPAQNFRQHTCCVNHLYSSSAESSMSPSLTAPSLQPVMSVEYSSPSNRPGTSPLASKVFMRSRKLESSTLDSSMMKQIFSSCFRHNKFQY